jgi:periplasmic protein TonB
MSSSVPPIYPPEALRSRAEGWVVVELLLSAEGSVAGMKVQSSKRAEPLKAAAVKAAVSTEYKPGAEETCKMLYTFTLH